MWLRNLLAVIAFCWLSGCQSQKPLETVDYVDLQRFMGDWYVIANIPTFLEKNAYNPYRILCPRCRWQYCHHL
jgi:apolipoprotein D and lipocalin family protein